MPYLNFVYLLRMNSSKWAIGVSFLSYFLLVTDIQGQNWEHSISLGYTFFRVEKYFSGTRWYKPVRDLTHCGRSQLVNPGLHMAYGLKCTHWQDVLCKLWNRFDLATFGIYLLQKDLWTLLLGLSNSHSVRTLRHRRDLQQFLSTSSPCLFSIPFSEKGRTFLKVGADLMWQVKDNSSWEFLEVTWQYQRLDTAWSSQILQTEVLQETLETTRIQRGIFLSIWNK